VPTFNLINRLFMIYRLGLVLRWLTFFILVEKSWNIVLKCFSFACSLFTL